MHLLQFKETVVPKKCIIGMDQYRSLTELCGPGILKIVTKNSHFPRLVGLFLLLGEAFHALGPGAVVVDRDPAMVAPALIFFVLLYHVPKGQGGASLPPWFPRIYPLKAALPSSMGGRAAHSFFKGPFLTAPLFFSLNLI